MSLTLECIYQHHAGPVKTLTSNTYPEILSSQEFLFPESLRGAGIGAAGAGSGATGVLVVVLVQGPLLRITSLEPCCSKSGP